MNSYHNTCGLEDTREYERKAVSQDEAILAYFRTCDFGTMFSPSELHRQILPTAPITSVRRALTNLTNAGLLVKTEKLVNGLYGRPEGLWRLAEPHQEKLL